MGEGGHAPFGDQDDTKFQPCCRALHNEICNRVCDLLQRLLLTLHLRQTQATLGVQQRGALILAALGTAREAQAHAGLCKAARRCCVCRQRTSSPMKTRLGCVARATSRVRCEASRPINRTKW